MGTIQKMWHRRTGDIDHTWFTTITSPRRAFLLGFDGSRFGSSAGVVHRCVPCGQSTRSYLSQGPHALRRAADLPALLNLYP